MTAQGIIFDIKKYAINDGPGIRTTVFFQGCPLFCQWCHNPESQPRKPVLLYRATRCMSCGVCAEVCPHGIIHVNGGASTDRSLCDACGACAEVCYRGARELSGRLVTADLVMREIERDVPFYDQSGGGVTFSGGEPLLQHGFLLVLLQRCRALDIHTVVDTCGHTTWDALSSLRPWVNLFLYDLKLMDDRRHRRYTGVSNQLILDNLQRLVELHHPVIVRIPYIPGVNDDTENLRAAAAFLAGLPVRPEVELMGYHDLAAAKYQALEIPNPLSDVRPPAWETLTQAGRIFSERGLKVKLS